MDGRFAIDTLAKLSTDEAYEILVAQRGIGPWTANIYLMTVLGCPDIWPNGARALAVAAKEVKNLKKVPSYDDLAVLAEAWRPWRSVAARLLWHHYLNTPRKKP